MKAQSTMRRIAEDAVAKKGVRVASDGRVGWFLTTDELRDVYNAQGFVALPGRSIVAKHAAIWEAQGLAIVEGDLINDRGGLVWMRDVYPTDSARIIAIERAGLDPSKAVIV